MSLFANPYINPNSGGGVGGSSVELSNSITSSSTTTAASSLAVKLVNDRVGENIDNIAELGSTVNSLENSLGSLNSTVFTLDSEIESVSSELNTKAPSVHDHDSAYYKKEVVDSIINSLNNSLHKVKTVSSDTPDYLVHKLDNSTIVIEDNEIKVKGMDGLTTSSVVIDNLLSGATGNIQSQINSIMSIVSSAVGGVEYRGKFESYADLSAVSNMKNGDLAVVLSDDQYLDARTLRIYNETLGFWDFIGAFEFSDSFVALTDTPSSYVGQNNKVLKVDEINNKIKFESIGWNELDGKPNSTKTQIDNAVSKMHDHEKTDTQITNAVNMAHSHAKTDAEITNAVNKTHEHTNMANLNRIGINSEGYLTIDGVSIKKKKEILSAYLSSTITVGLNDYIKFNSVKPISNIPYDSGTGMFTLTPTKTYRVTVSVMGAIPRYTTISFARGAEKVKSNPYTTVYGATTVANRGSSGVLDTTFTIGESSGGLYGILVTELGDSATSVELFGNRTMIVIQEIEV